MNDLTDHQKPDLWYALGLTIDGEAREAVEYALMEAGALGTETQEAPNEIKELVLVTGYFDQTPAREQVRGEPHASDHAPAWVVLRPARGKCGV